MLSTLLKKNFENFDWNHKNLSEELRLICKRILWKRFLRPYGWNPNYVASSRKTSRKGISVGNSLWGLFPKNKNKPKFLYGNSLKWLLWFYYFWKKNAIWIFLERTLVWLFSQTKIPIAIFLWQGEIWFGFQLRCVSRNWLRMIHKLYLVCFRSDSGLKNPNRSENILRLFNEFLLTYFQWYKMKDDVLSFCIVICPQNHWRPFQSFFE